MVVRIVLNLILPIRVKHLGCKSYESTVSATDGGSKWSKITLHYLKIAPYNFVTFYNSVISAYYELILIIFMCYKT